MGSRANYDGPGYRPAELTGDLATVAEAETSARFVDGMRNRMLISFYKYGPVAAGYPDRVDAIGSIAARLEKYQATGNAEWLMDVANFAMIEFMHPRHPGAHFRPTDSDESPGRARFDGADIQGANRPVDASVERLRARYRNGE